MKLTKKWQNILLTILLAVSFIWNAFSANVMEQFVHLNSFRNIFGALLRWLSMTGFLILPAALLLEDSRCVVLARFVVFPATLLGLLFTQFFFAIHLPTLPEVIAYAFYNSITLIACTYLFFAGAGADRKIVRQALLLFCLLVLPATFPLNIFMQRPSLMSHKQFGFVRFGGWHFLFILLGVFTTIALYYFLRNKLKKERYFYLFLLSLALFFQLAVRFSFVRLQDYQDAKGIIGALPFYVCSFGIALLPFAVLSRSNLFQGMLFLVNCPGAIIAFVWPNTGPVTIFHYNVTYFALSHIFLFAVTAHLAISLDGAPSGRHLLHLSYSIAIYYVAMVFLNAAAIARGNGYNPNFSFVSISPLPLPLHSLWLVKIGPVKFSPVYITILCVVQFALCLVTFAMYRILSHLCDPMRKMKKTASAKNIPPVQ